MSDATGIVGEFLSLKADTDADLLAMQVGDFYEFFDDDAETVAEELDLKVSKKSSHGSSYPMAGVPVDELTPYLKGLVERGYRVAVADQHETADGHARSIDRIVTPGTLLETTGADARYLVAIVEGEPWGLAFADVTTGQFYVTSVPDREAVFSELYRFDPAEVLPGPTVRTDDEALDRLRERTDASLSLHATEAFAPGRARHRLDDHFGAEAIDSVGVDAAAAIAAAGAVLAYVEETGQGVLASMTRLQRYGASEHVELDATTQRNLELTETMQGKRSGSLLETIDHTVTSAGTRTLRAWLQRPQRTEADLHRRQESVGALAAAAMARERLREELGDAYDLQRLASMAVSGSADARDLRAVTETLETFETVLEIVKETPELADSPLTERLTGPDHNAVRDLAAELDAAIAEDPPGTISDGGLIRRGYDDQLDGIVQEYEAAVEWIETLPDREQREHDITHLSVDRNKTDGYYIQVGNSETDDVPGHYEEIKTLKNAKRYTIPELTEREREIFRLEERRHDRERELFEAVRETAAERAELLQDVGTALATVDVLAALATHAVRNDWTRPELLESRALDVEAGRHPVVEQSTEFVPNDLFMDADRQFLIVTGPNMSGKSTYMRQAALIVLLAQIGSFVPARSARVGLVDGIYTRVGALDELAQGRSTFMVEMQELSNILHSATEESLVILDEVGRGTATFDGISIAWAATEYLHNEVGSKTLFATHYHELTTLAEHLPRVENVHVAVDGEPRSPSTSATSSRSGGEHDGDVTFLRTVRDGPTDRSYGIHVADLAGVPDPVVDRSRDVLDRLRAEKAIEAKGGTGGTTQAVFDLSDGEFTAEEGRASADGGEQEDDDRIADRFGEPAEEVLKELSNLDVNETPPVEVLSKVQQWQASIDEE